METIVKVDFLKLQDSLRSIQFCDNRSFLKYDFSEGVYMVMWGL